VTQPGGFIQKDPESLENGSGPNNDPLAVFFADDTTIKVRAVDGSANPTFTSFFNDANTDGDPDKIIGGWTLGFHFLLFLLDAFDRGLVPKINSASFQDSYKTNNVSALSNGLFASALEITAIDATGVPTFKTTNVAGATIDNDLPDDLFVVSVKCVQYSPTEMLLMFLTNYGILIKTAIDISNLLLSADDVSLKDTNLLLYPNPANDLVSFSDNSIKNIEVYDINGRRVLNTTNTSSFSVKTLAQGIYIVKGTNDNNVIVTKKLIVK